MLAVEVEHPLDEVGEGVLRSLADAHLEVLLPPLLESLRGGRTSSTSALQRLELRLLVLSHVVELLTSKLARCGGLLLVGRVGLVVAVLLLSELLSTNKLGVRARGVLEESVVSSVCL